MEGIESLQIDLGTGAGGRPSAQGIPLSIGEFCAASVGFSLPLRVGALASLKWCDTALLTDQDGATVLRIELPRSKTDQYNEGRVKSLKSIGRHLRPAEVFSRWLSLRSPASQEEGPVFRRALRAKLTGVLKHDAAFWDIDRARVGTHSMREGVEALTFDMGFEPDVIKRWGRRIPTAFRNYLWRDEHILANIGRGLTNRAPVSGLDGRMSGNAPQSPQSTDRAGGKMPRPTEHDSRQRLVAISKTMSGALRHRKLEGMDDEGRAPIRSACNIKR